jgi:lipid II:glycine glycyltransferase (peptidoglycan interpeptide bridge formation enzyme)
MKILINENVDCKNWDEFVAKNTKGNIFQTYEMYEIYKDTKNYEPLILVVTDDNNNILAGLVASIIWEPNLKSFSARSIIKGGPVWTDENALVFLLQEYDKIAKNKALYGEIRNIFELSEIREILQKHNYKFEGELNFVNNLKLGKDNLWKNLTKARRNGITKAKRLGVSIVEVADKKELAEAYSLFGKTYRQASWPLADKSLFEATFDILTGKKLAKFFLAKAENKAIAAAFVTIYNKYAYLWYLGSDNEFSKYCPNDLLLWHIMELCTKNGFEGFDFGGAGDPDKPYGVRDFKQQFGGELTNYGRHIKIYHPWKVKFAKKGFEVYRRIFK